MPPRIPVRFPWVSRATIRAGNGVNNALYIRTFSSTSPSLALGPESPNYIEVPKPLQPSYPPNPEIKGHLPIPRDVFNSRSKLSKLSKESKFYKQSEVSEESKRVIRNTSKLPKKAKLPGPYSQDADYRLYKQRLAESRRHAFREGVKELHTRKTKLDAQHTARIQANNTDRRARAMAPPRTVDVLTQTSISRSIRDFLEDKLPSTSREQIVQGRRKAYAKRMAKQEAVRRERVHDLYVNAREFIVNEEQLDDAIEKAFGTEEHPVRWDNHGATSEYATGLSPWDGPIPEGVTDKLQKLKGGEGVGLAKERVKKVAEALTGGKM